MRSGPRPIAVRIASKSGAKMASNHQVAPASATPPTQVVRPHVRRVVVDNVVFEEDAVPARHFRQLGQVGEGARIAARSRSRDLKAITHVHLLGPPRARIVRARHTGSVYHAW